ncbi:glycosyltransferase family 2 protein [Roseixanthobacter glucoisosaccharinicivorans]|uniref:glycosyltransferase family 2 protein n=1 Tax=Roseixanthobacter glucoisosaccharinicivorans TaxID=3119923 RepID=UPI003729315F
MTLTDTEANDAPPVSVILVSYNSGAVIGRAIASVPEGCEVIVVDNASPQGTPFMADLARPARLIALPRNLGFGTACNEGARAARGEYVFFLNPDAALAPDALERLVAAERAYGPAIIMPSILGETGRPMRKEGSILEPVARGARLKAEEIAGDYCTRFVHGAAFLMKRQAFLDLGGFDEQIFLYHEDDDLALRALARDLPIVVVPGAQVSHSGGKSSTGSWGATFAINRYKKRSELYVRRKYGRAPHMAKDALRLVGGCLLALATFDIHRFMIRAGKLAGLLDGPGAPTGSGREERR